MNNNYTYSVVKIHLYEYETGTYEVELDFNCVEDAIKYKNELELDNYNDDVFYKVIVNE